MITELDSPPPPCTAVLCVLNEAALIAESISALRALRLRALIVVDGGSSDGTHEFLLKQNDLTLISLPAVGLLSQRLAGIGAAQTDIVLLVDVDDKIEPAGFQAALAQLAGRSDLDGLQFHLSTPGRTYWERAWAAYFGVISVPQSRPVLLGRPCLAYAKNYHFGEGKRTDNIFAEDTWIHLQERELSRKYEVTSSSSSRECPLSFQSNFAQFVRYGESDSRICSSAEESLNLLFHTSIRIAIFRSLVAIKTGRWRYAPFFVLMGGVRTLSHLITSIRDRAHRP